MRKTTKVLAFINAILSIFVISIIIQYLLQSSQTSDGWADLGLFLIALVFVFTALILTIPFIVFLIKIKYDNIKFYVLSHIVFFILSAALFAFSLLN